MARPRGRFVCRSCGETLSKWFGRCPSCDAWDSLEELAIERSGATAPAAAAVPLEELAGASSTARLGSGLPGLDAVLGGGVVPGGATLLAGEPGIGKSTLLLQLAGALTAGGARPVYVSAEESPQQIRLRAERLEVDGRVQVAATSELEPVLALVNEAAPTVLLVDSIQALRSEALESPPGSVAQVRHCAERLVGVAKRHDTALFLVGHVTKEGAIAGPKSLEHLVDAVLSFDGERDTRYRVLQAVKNRFGATGEVALFEMGERGLLPVADPARVLLTRQHGAAPGSVVTAAISGSRALVVEIQALVHRSSLPAPRRMSVGLEGNRVALLVAVLERFAGARLADQDLFLNVIGGLALRDPATDLAVAAAVLSAAHQRPLPRDAVFFGELGLLGEVRPMSRSEERLRAAAALGFRRAFVAAGDPPEAPNGMRLVGLERIEELARRFDAGAG